MTERKEYIDKMAEQLKSWDNELVKYQEKAKNVNESMRKTYQEEITRLKGKMAQAQNKLNEMKQTGDGAWKELKSGIEKSWTELRSSFETARSKFQ